MTTITLDLPERTIERAKQAATILQRPIDEVINDMLIAALPATQDTPIDVQAELTRMTWLDTEALWEIARSQMSNQAQEQLHSLSQLQVQRPLQTEEAQKLEELRRDYGRITLLKARAYALLSLRGGKPLLN